MSDSLAHGRSKYTYDGCRCPVCTGDNAAYHAERRRKRAEWTRANGLPRSVAHGSSAYVNWGCRCAKCAEAHRERVAAYRARRLRGAA
jgi:hypothetical protein